MAEQQEVTKNDENSTSDIYENQLNIESLISAPLIAASKANAFMLQGQYRYLLDNCFYKVIKEKEEDIKIKKDRQDALKKLSESELKELKNKEENDEKQRLIRLALETREQKRERLAIEESERIDREKKVSYEPIMIKMAYNRSDVVQEDGKLNVVQKELQFTVPMLCLIPFSSIAVDKLTVDFDMEIISVTSYKTDHGVLDKQAQLHGRISPASDSVDSRNQKSCRLKVNINAGQLPLPSGLLSIIDLYSKSIQPVSDVTIKKKQIES
jgi:hypothetical protein